MTEQTGSSNKGGFLRRFRDQFAARWPRGRVPAGALVVALACVIGLVGGFGASLFRDTE